VDAVFLSFIQHFYGGKIRDFHIFMSENQCSIAFS